MAWTQVEDEEATASSGSPAAAAEEEEEEVMADYDGPKGVQTDDGIAFEVWRQKSTPHLECSSPSTLTHVARL